MQSGKMDHPFLGPGPPGARAFVTAGRQLQAHRSVARPPPSCKGIRSRDGFDYRRLFSSTGAPPPASAAAGAEGGVRKGQAAVKLDRASVASSEESFCVRAEACPWSDSNAAATGDLQDTDYLRFAKLRTDAMCILRSNLGRHATSRPPHLPQPSNRFAPFH